MLDRCQDAGGELPRTSIYSPRGSVYLLTPLNLKQNFVKSFYVNWGCPVNFVGQAPNLRAHSKTLTLDPKNMRHLKSLDGFRGIVVLLDIFFTLAGLPPAGPAFSYFLSLPDISSPTYC
jgi:hypothetical protein